MSYVRNWLHCVWGTKKRFPFLTPHFREELIDHIKQNAITKAIYMDAINGHTEHIHCLISLHPDQSLSKVMQLIKGESSFWINKQKVVPTRFEWADEYYAASVSESLVKKVRQYIRNQDEHHRTKTWQEESDEFLRKHGFDRLRG
jgi:putative transposase